jgi:hypothetical protein
VIRLITDPEAVVEPSPEAGPATSPLVDILSAVSSLAWLVGPVAPRAVAHVRGPSLLARLPAGSTVADLELEIRNGQECSTPIAIVVSSLRAAGGEVWAPLTEPGTVIVAPGEVRAVEVRLLAASRPEPGRYEGELRLLGVEGAVVEIAVEVAP